MTFVKVVKNKAYFKRFQVKYRRRREGKTDYFARRRLVTQDKNKYNSPKYRLVVRMTNRRIICQVIFATIQGDRVLEGADSSELARYGLPVGLTNYAAGYATGLLLARRLLKKLGLDSTFEGMKDADGEEFHIEEEDSERRPFKCCLDVGLVRTTTGNRVFGVMKGACDGGLHIPHSNKRFPGFTKDGESENYDAAVHRDRIFGVHVAKYMQLLKEESPEEYERKFSQYIKSGITSDSMEDKYKAAHAAIRADPTRPTPKPRPVASEQPKSWRTPKLTREQRRERVQRKLALLGEHLASKA